MKWRKESKPPEAPDEAIIQRLETLIEELGISADRLEKATKKAVAAAVKLNQAVERADRASRRPTMEKRS